MHRNEGWSLLESQESKAPELGTSKDILVGFGAYNYNERRFSYIS